VKRISFLFRYLRYLISSKNEHGIHSPFIFDLVTDVFYAPKGYYVFSKIAKIRNALLINKELVPSEDFGAGSVHSKKLQRSICDLAKNSAKNEKFGMLLFKLVNLVQPKTILELGTSLGISGMYLGSARKNAKFITIEAIPSLVQVAAKNFSALGLSNVSVVEGTFEDKLDTAIGTLKSLDFVFFDGNHRKDATLSYFNKCLEYTHSSSVFVFDDIHWSRGMEEAWAEIKANPKVRITVDLFFIGIVFFRKSQAKEDFIVRF
jgi:predicted O-methyltransferase YrrM